MRSLSRALITMVLSVAALGAAGIGEAHATGGLASDTHVADVSGVARDGWGHPVPKGAVRVVLDEPVREPPVPLAADVSEQTLGMGLSSEPALAASLVAIGCLISWRSRRSLARRGMWSHL